ncbi:MAG: hypothetical protein ACRCZF_21730, partial [Gemmataceae bacterium]
MTIKAAVTTVTVCTVLFAGIGAGIGWALGTYSPGYYRSVFHGGQEPWFDPVAVGVGQGLTQGVAGGVAVGLVVVALFLWADSRVRRQSEPTPPAGGSSPAGGGPPVGRYING